MNKLIKILIITIIIGSVILVLGSCREITQKDVDREANRWWVINYKILEPGNKVYQSSLIGEAEETLNQEFGGENGWVSFFNNKDTTIKSKYYFLVRRNKLYEEVLLKLKGEKALKEIEGKYSLEEAYDSLEKANEAIGQ